MNDASVSKKFLGANGFSDAFLSLSGFPGADGLSGVDGFSGAEGANGFSGVNGFSSAEKTKSCRLGMVSTLGVMQ